MLVSSSAQENMDDFKLEALTYLTLSLGTAFCPLSWLGTAAASELLRPLSLVLFEAVVL